jgi:RNA-directed DNA polymerase
MEQDTYSISWKDLPWQKFQKKSFRLQCKIYKAKQNNNPRLVRRFQKLLLKSKSVHYLAVRSIAQTFRYKGLFLSGDKKFSLVEESYCGIGYWKHKSFKSFSKPKNSRAFFNISFLRNKVIEYVWKFTIEPTCVNNFINLNKNRSSNSNKNILQEFINFIRFKKQRVLKVAVSSYLTNINFNTLMSYLWLPSKYKLGIYRAIKKCALESNASKRTLISFFPSILLDGLEKLNTIPIQANKSTDYLCKCGFRYDNEIFYFLRKDQNEISLFNMIRDFLESRGLSINSTTISIKELSSGFTFSSWDIRHRRDGKILVLPNFTSWCNYKKNIRYTLKKEHISAHLKIKKLESMLMTWVQYNNCCSKVKLKSSFFYLKNVLAKYN